MSTGLRQRWARGQVCLLAVLLTACAAREVVEPAAPPTEPTLSVQLLAQWWLEDQMDGLRLDAPPPKRRTLDLVAWDASDPVGTPHPDVIAVVVDATADGPLAFDQLSVRKRWQVGPIAQATHAVWGDWVAMADTPEVTRRDGSLRVRYRVPIRAELDRLFAEGRWAYRFDVVATLAGAPDTGGAAAVMVRRSLPIYLGD